MFIFRKVFLNCFIFADSFKVPETSYISRLSLDGDIGNVFSPFVIADISQVFTPSDQASWAVCGLYMAIWCCNAYNWLGNCFAESIIYHLCFQRSRQHTIWAKPWVTSLSFQLFWEILLNSLNSGGWYEIITFAPIRIASCITFSVKSFVSKTFLTILSKRFKDCFKLMVQFSRNRKRKFWTYAISWLD